MYFFNAQRSSDETASYEVYAVAQRGAELLERCIEEIVDIRFESERESIANRVRFGLTAIHLLLSPSTAIFEVFPNGKPQPMRSELPLHRCIKQCIECINDCVEADPAVADFLREHYSLPFRQQPEGLLLDYTAFWLDRVSLKT